MASLHPEHTLSSAPGARAGGATEIDPRIARLLGWSAAGLGSLLIWTAIGLLIARL